MSEETRLERIVKIKENNTQRVDSWNNDWKVVLDDLCGRTDLTRLEALAFLLLMEAMNVAASYREMVEFSNEQRPKFERMLEIAERQMEEMEKDDDWKGDDDPVSDG